MIFSGTVRAALLTEPKNEKFTEGKPSTHILTNLFRYVNIYSKKIFTF